MPNIFPTLSCGSPVLYPLARSINFLTTVNVFLDDSQQRWREHTRLESFDLTFNNLKLADLNLILAFWRSMRGPDHTDWQITIDGVTYLNCTFAEDSLSYSEADEYPELYSLQVSARQAVQAAPRTSVDPGAFPTFNAGMRFQRPLSATLEFRTTINEMPDSGDRIAHAERTTSIVACTPAHTNLFSWDLQYPCLDATEAAALETHFLNAEGRYAAFTFTDPLGGVHAKVCYGMDSLRWQYSGPGSYSTRVLLQEVR